MNLRMFWTCFPVTLAIIVMLGLASASAQSGDSQSSRPYFVGEVVVNSEADNPTNGTGTVAVLEADEIAALGVTSVAEALEHVTGVSMSTGARNEQRIWIRGYQQSEVLVLIDGIPIADPYSGQVDLGQIPVSDVAKIIVTRGGASPLYGPNALGGVINIVTVQGAEGLSAKGNIRTTKNSTVEADAGFGGARGPFDWYLGATFGQSDGFDLSKDFVPTPFQPSGTRVNSDFERFSMMGRVGLRSKELGRFTATFRLIDAEKGVPFHTTQPSGFIKFSRFPEWRQGTAAVGWEKNLKNTRFIRSQIFSHSFDNTLDVYSDPDLQDLILRSAFADDSLGGFVVTGQTIGSHYLTGALHFREDRHRRYEGNSPAAQVLVETYTSRLGSASVEDRLDLSANWRLILGGSLDSHRVEESWNATEGFLGQSSDTAFSPQIELGNEITPTLSGSFSIYRKTRFPTIQQLFAGDVPSPHLQPERVTGSTLEYRWQPHSSLELDTSLYFDRVNNVISRIGRHAPYENHDEAEIYGAEISVRAEKGRWDGRFSGTWQSAEFTQSAQGMQEIPYVPESTAEARLRYRGSHSTNLLASWQWIGPRIFYHWDDRRSLDGYSLVRLSLSQGWKNLEFRLDLENALDANIEQEWGYPLPGRRMWLSLRFVTP
jgi:iron complex outermembrane receptor protein